MSPTSQAHSLAHGGRPAPPDPPCPSASQQPVGTAARDCPMLGRSFVVRVKDPISLWRLR
jgi:hypothetical protein